MLYLGLVFALTSSLLVVQHIGAYLLARRPAIAFQNSMSTYDELLRKDSIRYKALISYDGTDFCGFQLQPRNQRTVQGEIERVLQQRFQHRVIVVGASRTDSGVHARGQVIHFDLPTGHLHSPLYEEVAISSLRYSMNQMLPEDVRIRLLCVAPSPSPYQSNLGLPWCANTNSTGKLYTYRFALADVMNPLDGRQRTCFPPLLYPVNLELMEKTLQMFVGTKDFRAFSSKADKLAAEYVTHGRGLRNTTRTIYSIKMHHSFEQNDDKVIYVNLNIILDGALYKMVRHIVGAIIAISSGRMHANIVKDALKTGEWVGGPKDRCQAPPAPAKGLVLEKVFYQDAHSFQVCNKL